MDTSVRSSTGKESKKRDLKTEKSPKDEVKRDDIEDSKWERNSFQVRPQHFMYQYEGPVEASAAGSSKTEGEPQVEGAKRVEDNLDGEKSSPGSEAEMNGKEGKAYKARMIPMRFMLPPGLEKHYSVGQAPMPGLYAAPSAKGSRHRRTLVAFPFPCPPGPFAPQSSFRPLMAEEQEVILKEPPPQHKLLPDVVDMRQYDAMARLWMEQQQRQAMANREQMFQQSRASYLNSIPEQDHQITGNSQSSSAVDASYQRSAQHKKTGEDGEKEEDEPLEFPMSPKKQSLLYFRIGQNWKDLAWLLCAGFMTSKQTIHMIQDIRLQHPGNVVDQAQDLVQRWWKRRGRSATMFELERALDALGMVYVRDELLSSTDTSGVPLSSPTDAPEKQTAEVRDSNNLLDVLDDADPELLRRMQREYTLRTPTFDFSGDLFQGQNPTTDTSFGPNRSGVNNSSFSRPKSLLNTSVGSGRPGTQIRLQNISHDNIDADILGSSFIITRS